MKNLFIKAIYLLLFMAAGMAATNAQVQYFSPVPFSKFNNPKTNIILGIGREVLTSSADKKKLFTVTGSLSGNHNVKVMLVEKGKSVLLSPLTPFAAGETVTVSMSNGIETVAGELIPATQFSFDIQPSYSEEERKTMAEQMRMVYAEDEPSAEQKTELKGGTNSGFPDFTITTNTNPAPGNVFFSHFNNFVASGSTSHYCIIESDGDSVFGKYDTINFNNFDLNRNGYLTLYNTIDSTFGMLDSNYYQIGTYQMGNGYMADVHEFQILPDGSHWMLCYDPQIVDMTVYNPTYNPHTTVVGAVIQKLDANNNVVFQWRSWDHFSILDPEHIPFNTGFIDDVHANAIEIDNDGNILLSSRHLCEITKINVTTGAIIWRMGGKNNQFTFINDTEAPQYHYQHDIHRLANGNVTLFDNGNYHTPPCSYAKEYTLNEVTKTATLVWSYKRTVASGDVYSVAMGNVQRLSNGNTFIDWGLELSQTDAPKMTEVDANKNIVWELKFSNQDAVYRAHRREWNPCSRPTSSLIKVKKITATTAKVDWEAATGAISYDVHYRKLGNSTWKLKNATDTYKKLKNLTPGKSYEYQVRTLCAGNATSGWTVLDTFTTLPQKILLSNENILSVDLHPNPAADNLEVEFTLQQEANADFSIYDIAGRLMLSETYKLNEGDQLLHFDVSKFPQGIYFVEMKSGSSKVVQKIVKQ